MTSKAQSEVFRPIANFSKNIWKDQFPCFPPSNLAQEFDSLTKEIEPLKEKVRDMLTACTADTLENVKFIDTLLRLGVSYHFEKEIEKQLERIFDSQKVVVNGNHDYNLNSTSILFRVLRQHGFKMPCGVFETFKGKDGKFKESLIDDVRGMLSLYEAAYLRVHGENILEEALVFTKANLKSLAMKSKPRLAKQITDALDHPLNKCPPRLAARNYIPFYDEEEESRNETLLRFAKLDFNRLQLLHKQEICHIAGFWNDYAFSSEFSYARERYVEIYLWINSLFAEPRYTCWRIILSKIVILISILDDTFDAYGTPQELKCLIDILKRWEMAALDELQDYTKAICKAVRDIFSEIEEEARKEGTSYGLPYAKDSLVVQLITGYQLETKWCHGDYVPTFEEYKKVATKTIACDPIITISFMGMGQIAEVEAFEWLQGDPKIMKSVSIIGRFKDDIESHEFEQMRKHCPSSVECYMKQHNVKEKDALEELEEMIEDSWKVLNEECMRPTAVPRDLLSLPKNLARITHLFYKHGDGYTHPEYVKGDIRALFVDPIPL